MFTKRQTVHVRINDAATGKPTPCRVRFQDSAGNYYAPFGRLTSFATAPGIGVGGNVTIDGNVSAYIDGACEIDLPPGQIRVQVWKGPEYRPLDESIVLIAGKLSLRLTIERWANLREEGWFSGDVRAHHLSPSAALLEAQAEDLAVANILIREGRTEDQNWLGNILEFSGQQPATQVPGHLVAVNSYNQSPMGALGLLNCHRVVYPLAVERINWTLADWCGQCHRKGGLVVWPDFDKQAGDDWVSEALANLILGNVDALEMTDLSWVRSGHEDWYHLLNCGLRVPLVGSSGKDSNLVPLGRVRTYAKLDWGEEMSYKRWIEAARAGRTFISNGPLIWFAVEGQEAGNVVTIAPAQDRVKVRAKTKSLREIERLEIIAGGEVIAQASGRDGVAEIEIDFPIKESAWLAARCFFGESSPCAAHTSPVYVRLDDTPFRPRRASLDHVEQWLSRYQSMLHRFDKEGRFASAPDREHLEKVYVEAYNALQRIRGAGL